MIKKYISAIVCGFGAGVLQIVPLLKSFACCLFIPFAAFLSLLLDQRANKSIERITAKKAFTFGLLTGIYAALFGSVFEILITFITKHNDIIAAFPQMQKMIEGFPVSSDVKQDVLKLFQNIREDLITKGFSWLYTLTIFLNNFLVNSIFGIAGGLIGAQILNNKLNKRSDEN